LGEAMRGRQLPHVDPHADSMGWPQLGQDSSSVRDGADNDNFDDSLAETASSTRPLHDGGIFRRGTGLRLRWLGAEGIPLDEEPPPPRSCFSLSNTKSSPVTMIGLPSAMVKHLSQRFQAPEVS